MTDNLTNIYTVTAITMKFCFVSIQQHDSLKFQFNILQITINQQYIILTSNIKKKFSKSNFNLSCVCIKKKNDNQRTGLLNDTKMIQNVYN